MIKSNTKIEKQLKKKTNSELVETIILAKKNKGWNEVASIISSPRRLKLELNLDRLNKETKAGETAVIPGKILSLGKIEKKIKAVALAFSEKAREKLLDLMLRDGISGQDVIKAIQKEIWNLPVEPEVKVKLTEKTGEAEFRIVEGSDPFIQLQSLLASFVLAGLGL